MQIVFASDNPNKLREVGDVLISSSYQIIAQAKYNVSEIAETGLTFVENAILKVRNAARYSKLPALADDSGLVIDALHGAPGIYSARFAGSNATSEANVTKVLRLLKDVPLERRSARFYCVLVFLKHKKDPAPLIAQGVWEGRILTKPQGSNGFGYDPIFFVPSHNCSAAELPLEEKNRISHRGQALRQLVELLQRAKNIGDYLP